MNDGTILRRAPRLDDTASLRALALLLCLGSVLGAGCSDEVTGDCLGDAGRLCDDADHGEGCRSDDDCAGRCDDGICLPPGDCDADGECVDADGESVDADVESVDADECGVDGAPPCIPIDGGVDHSPLLSGFRVAADDSSSVHFEASEPILGSTTDGFVVSDSTITGLVISPDGLSGRLTVSGAFDFFSNNLIRYEGGADITDRSGNPLHPFDLQYIDNELSEPSAPQNRYVSVGGDDGDDGMSEATAWRTIAHAAREVTAGTTVWVQAGDYGAESIDVVNHGRVDAPIKLVGYRDSPGDHPTLPRSQDTVFSATEMPLIHSTSSSGHGFGAYDRDYIIVRNMQFEGYDIPVDMKEARFSIVDNVYVDGGRVNINAFPEYDAIQLRIINSYSRNASHEGIYLSGARHLVENNYVTSNRRLGMDYYIVVVGGTSGVGEHCVRGNSVVRYFDDSHPGHGLSYKAQGRAIEHSLMENNYVENVGLAIEARHSQVRHCVWRDNTLNFTGVDNNSYVGIQVTSARDCVFDGIVGIDYEYFVRFLGSTEDPAGADAGNGNLFKNCLFYSTEGSFSAIVEIREDTEGLNRVPHDNTIANCTFSGAQGLYFDNFDGPEVGTGNLFVNTIFHDVDQEYLVDTDPIDFEFEHSAFYNADAGTWSSTAPAGEGNISADPTFTSASDFTPGNAALNAGVTVPAVRYDLNGRERFPPYTIGAIEVDE